jgi:arylsulfatase
MNILFVISDQHQATCMGAEGHPHAITPNMDRLSADGVRFAHAYCQSPICTPSRVSILSGQYCHNHSYYGLGGPTPANLPSFMQYFKRHGYRTAGIGKLHAPTVPVNWLKDHCDCLVECYFDGKEDKQTPYFEYLRQLGLRDKEDSILLPEFPGTQQHDARPSKLPYEHSVEGWCVQEAIKFMDQ